MCFVDVSKTEMPKCTRKRAFLFVQNKRENIINMYTVNTNTWKAVSNSGLVFEVGASADLKL